MLLDQKATFSTTDPLFLLGALLHLGFQDTWLSWLFSPHCPLLSVSFAGSSSSPWSIEVSEPELQSSDHFSFPDPLIILVISSSLVALNTMYPPESSYIYVPPGPLPWTLDSNIHLLKLSTCMSNRRVQISTLHLPQPSNLSFYRLPHLIKWQLHSSRCMFMSELYSHPWCLCLRTSHPTHHKIISIPNSKYNINQILTTDYLLPPSLFLSVPFLSFLPSIWM